MGKVINRVELGDPVQASGGVLDLYRELALARLGEGFVRIVLFGSRARGDQRAESDWDVAVPQPRDHASRPAAGIGDRPRRDVRDRSADPVGRAAGRALGGR
jgi:predicted nucleotidyltransferase